MGIMEGMCWEPKLRPAEWKIWSLVAEGLGNREIGATCGYGEKYVAQIVGTLYLKLQLPDGSARRVKLALKYPGRPTYNFHCLRCGQHFTNRVEEPNQCNKCFSQYWDTKRTIRKPG